MEEEEFETRSDEIKRIVGDLHEQGLTEAQILQKLMEYLGVPISWEKSKRPGRNHRPRKRQQRHTKGARPFGGLFACASFSRLSQLRSACSSDCPRTSAIGFLL